ncbi:MAG: AI-2E family transporter [Chitinophagaceae bacterium]|nr:MAG: AI-2E family transporter [Chitinophagaceae bacterium]
MQTSYSRSWPFYAKLALVLFSLIAMTYIAIVIKEVLSPLLFSLLFSVVLLPVTGFLERKLKLPGGIAAGISITLLLALFVLVFYFLGSQISDLAQDWPQFQQQINISFKQLQQWVEKTMHINVKEQLNYVDKATSEVISSSTTVIGATVASVSSILLFVVFAMIYTFFLLFYRRLILKFLIAVFKEENSVTVYDIVEQVQYIVRKYILGLLLEMLIVSAAFCIAFLLLGIKYAILLGLIAGIFNLIPYIGIFTSLVLSTFITFATGAATAKILIVVAIYFGIHLVDSNVLLPLIVGSKVRINALVTVLGVILGEMVWGISGMFLSIPVIAISKIIFDRVESLKPWGLLLGEEEENKPKSKKRIIVEAEHDKPAPGVV